MNFKAVTFIVSKTDSAEQVFERNNQNDSSAYRARLYEMLSNDQRNEFKALPIERQVWLLQVPLKRQAQYKKNGVEHYLSSLSQPRKPNGVSNKKVTRYMKRCDEREVTKAIKEGKPVNYE